MEGQTDDEEDNLQILAPPPSPQSPDPSPQVETTSFAPTNEINFELSQHMHDDNTIDDEARFQSIMMPCESSMYQNQQPSPTEQDSFHIPCYSKFLKDHECDDSFSEGTMDSLDGTSIDDVEADVLDDTVEDASYSSVTIDAHNNDYNELFSFHLPSSAISSLPPSQYPTPLPYQNQSPTEEVTTMPTNPVFVEIQEISSSPILPPPSPSSLTDIIQDNLEN